MFDYCACIGKTRGSERVQPTNPQKRVLVMWELTIRPEVSPQTEEHDVERLVVYRQFPLLAA